MKRKTARPAPPAPGAPGLGTDPSLVGGLLAPRLRLVHAVGLAALLAIVSGLNTLPNDFTYDDIPIIKENPLVTQPGQTLNTLKRHYWQHKMDSHGETNPDVVYRPFTILTYRLNYLVCGANPLGYHLVNLLLHAASSALVVILAVRFGCSIPGALLAGVLFAVMPIHTEAVANVVGRAELLAALWTLLAALCAIHIQFDAPAIGLAWSLGAAAAAFAAIMSKETGVVALALAPPLAAVSRPGWAAGKRLRIAIITAVVFILPAAAYFLLRYQATAGRIMLLEMPSRITNIMVDATATERFWGAWQIFGLYIAKTFWPHVLCMDYSFKTLTLADSAANLDVIIGIVTLAGLILASVAWWRRGQYALALAGPALLVAYFPMSNTLFLRILFAERVWYLPSAFLAIILGGLVSSWVVTRRRMNITVLVAFLAIIAGLARTWDRNAEWRDNGTLFASAYRDHPDSGAILSGYGQWLIRNGDIPGGLALLNRCVKIAPELSNAFLTLGYTYAELGDRVRAVEAFQAAYMKKPKDPEIERAWRAASDQLAAEQRTHLDQLRQRCDTQPASLPCFLDWTNALVEVGRTTEALSLFSSRDSRFGNSSDFQHARAVALMLAGKQDEAIETYRKASSLNAQDVEILVEFATALLDRHRPEDVRQASQLIDQANRIAPEHPRVLLIRAEWFEMNGRHDQAIALYRQLLRILPPGPLRDTIQARMNVTRQ